MRKIICDRCGNEIKDAKLKKVEIIDYGIEIAGTTDRFDVCEICAKHIREEFEYDQSRKEKTT